jgi:hypothetical protein
MKIQLKVYNEDNGNSNSSLRQCELTLLFYYSHILQSLQENDEPVTFLLDR